MMSSQLESRLAALGWGEVECEIETVFSNILWLYVCGSFDMKFLRRFLMDDGSPRVGEPGEAYLQLLTEMLNEAERTGRLACLAAPAVRTPEQILRLLSQRFADG